jgi:hypothetical protein
LNLFKKLGENGAVLSVESSLLSQFSLLTGKITGNLSKICYLQRLISKYYLGKVRICSKINRELFYNNREKFIANRSSCRSVKA